jgi:hypothetical protein
VGDSGMLAKVDGTKLGDGFSWVPFAPTTRWAWGQEPWTCCSGGSVTPEPNSQAVATWNAACYFVGI